MIIRIIFLKNRLNTQSKLVVAMKEFPYNPVLIINDNTLFPDGWLEMFLNDNKKYPNDAISASIQYFFGKNLNIMEFKEGYKGKKFGIFNHINNMIFNFYIIKTAYFSISVSIAHNNNSRRCYYFIVQFNLYFFNSCSFTDVLLIFFKFIDHETTCI